MVDLRHGHPTRAKDGLFTLAVKYMHIAYHLALILQQNAIPRKRSQQEIKEQKAKKARKK